MLIGQTKTLTIGGRTFTQAELERMETGTTGIILLSGILTAGRGTSFRTKTGAAYQVPANKVLKILAIKSHAITSSLVGIAYSDAEVTFDTASPGTNPVYYGGTVTAIYPVAYNTTPNEGESVIYFEVPASKYPFIYASATNVSALIYCLIDAA